MLTEGLAQRGQAASARLRAMLGFADGPDHIYRDAMLEAGLLEFLEPIILAGQSDPAYDNGTWLLSLLTACGHTRHHEALAKSMPAS